MSKRDTTLIVFFGFIVILFIVIAAQAPTPINWTQTYFSSDKKPYGSYLLYRLLPNLFPINNAVITDKPLKEYLAYEKPSLYNNPNLPESERVNWLFLDETLAFDEYETKDLLSFVESGNALFLASYQIRGALADSLGFVTTSQDFNFDTTKFNPLTVNKKDTAFVNLTNPRLKSTNNYAFGLEYAYYRFYYFDTVQTVVLGQDALGRVNFVRIPYGKGSVFVHCLPIAFTNYHLIDKANAEYASKCLSYLPSRQTFWDEYYKSKREISESELRFIKDSPPLSWAYYLTIVGVFAYIVMAGRRKQRIIPVIAKPINTTVEFVQTVGKLYFQRKNHKNIAMRRVEILLEHIRSTCYLPTDNLNNEFYENLSDKTGVPLQDITALFLHIAEVQNSESINERELIVLHERIERFYKAVK